MTITNAELRALAERATPGPWEVKWDTDEDYGGRPYRYPANIQSVETKSYIFDGYQIGADGSDYNGPNDAAYIAAAHPARIIELLDENATYLREYGNCYRDLTALRAKLEIAIRALEFYADQSKWQEDYADFGGKPVRVPGSDEASYDHGGAAIEALAQLKEQP